MSERASGSSAQRAREDVLGRIRAANAAAGSPPPPAVPRDYRTAGTLERGPLLDLLRDRLVDYQATVLDARADDTAPDGVAEAIRGALAEVDGPVVVPPGLPDGWVPDGTADDGQLSADELDGYAAVVTACAGACAETGTIALDGSPDQGRRAITLVPDVHVCVVRAEQVVQTVPELLARLEPTRPTTFVSGPSATSDIELQRVEGVHGPRTLVVVLVA
ncbi:LutC/YkgG family protein [Pseudonocardia nigra]|uniref:LutC/YkgG family protein n=1 Tax=Pseudonocardia nigra TaxID=1921578 RepID=UPI001C5D37C3|nr:LUD domain-containing protein [Pseudonocardia nigra]